MLLQEGSYTPEEKAEKGKFAKLFREFNAHLEAAIIQDFKWDKKRRDKNGSLWHLFLQKGLSYNSQLIFKILRQMIILYTL